MFLGVALTDRLMILKTLDSMIDFSKSTIQLEVLLYLGTKDSPVSVSEVARELRLRVKSAYDAMAKLLTKGLVKREGTGYVISSRGREFITNLYKLFTGELSHYELSRRKLRELKSLINNLIIAKYVYESLLTMGVSRKNEISINKLSALLGISAERVKDYLDVFANAKERDLKLFRKIVKRGKGIFRRNNNNCVYYRLTQVGLKELSKFHEYRRFKRNYFLRFILRITFSYKKSEAFKRLIMFIGIGTPIMTIISSFFGGTYLLAIWLYIATLLSVIALLSEYVE